MPLILIVDMGLKLEAGGLVVAEKTSSQARKKEVKEELVMLARTLAVETVVPMVAAEMSRAIPEWRVATMGAALAAILVAEMALQVGTMMPEMVEGEPALVVTTLLIALAPLVLPMMAEIDTAKKVLTMVAALVVAGDHSPAQPGKTSCFSGCSREVTGTRESSK